jgi:integrase
MNAACGPGLVLGRVAFGVGPGGGPCGRIGASDRSGTTTSRPSRDAAAAIPARLPKPEEPLPPALLHDLRHVHATTQLLAGGPVHVVADRLGHRHASTMLKVYAHVLREQAAGAADVVAQAVEAAVGKGVSR